MCWKGFTSDQIIEKQWQKVGSSQSVIQLTAHAKKNHPLASVGSIAARPEKAAKIKPTVCHFKASVAALLKRTIILSLAELLFWG